MHGIWLRYGMHLMSHTSWLWLRQTGCSWFCSDFPLQSRAVPFFFFFLNKRLIGVHVYHHFRSSIKWNGPNCVWSLPYSWKPWSISKRGQPWPWWHRLWNLYHKEGTCWQDRRAQTMTLGHFPLCPHPEGSIFYLIPPAADQNWISWLLNTSCVTSARSGEYISLSGDHCYILYNLYHNIPLSQTEDSWMKNIISIRQCSLWIKRLSIPLYVNSVKSTSIILLWFIFKLLQSTGVYSSWKVTYNKLWDVLMEGITLPSHAVALPFLVAVSQGKFEGNSGSWTDLPSTILDIWHVQTLYLELTDQVWNLLVHKVHG